MKAIIPVAGLGTRMLPATKATAKEMLTVVDKPLIQYIVHEAINAGITDIIFVTQADKSAIKRHFSENKALEDHLISHGKHDLCKEIQAISPKGLNITTVIQEHPKGLGHAVLCARPYINDNDFIVLLPDVLIQNHQFSNNLSNMISNFHHRKASQVMVESVPLDQVHKYGIADVDGKKLNKARSCSTINFIEKPSIAEAPSNFAIVGRYVLSKNIWPLLKQQQPGKGGEIQLTDAIDQLLLNEKVDAYCLDGESYDCGSKVGLLQANISMAMNDENLRDSITHHIEVLLKRNCQAKAIIKNDVSFLVRA
jgi:UTP--glucose-1-phosphate uridylyltransferase